MRLSDVKGRDSARQSRATRRTLDSARLNSSPSGSRTTSEGITRMSAWPSKAVCADLREQASASRSVFSKVIKEISVPLHHLGTLLKVFSGVVRCTHLVPFNMGQLTFDPIPVECVLVEVGRGNCPKPVRHHLGLRVPQTTKGRVHRVLAHRPPFRPE